MRTIILFLTSFVILFGCNTDNYQQSELNQQAKQLMLNGDYESSITLAKKSISTDANSENTYFANFVIGYNYRLQKDYQNSVPYLAKALKEIPKSKEFDSDRARIHMCLGRIYKLYRKYEISLKHYKQAEKFIDQNEKALLQYNIGKVHQHKGDYQASMPYFKKSLAIAKETNDLSRQARVYNSIGIMNKNLGHFMEAREDLFRIVQSDFPEYSKYAGKAYHNIANSYYEESLTIQGEEYKTELIDKSLFYFHKAIDTKQSKKERFITYMDLGGLHMQLNSVDSSRYYLTKAEEYYPLSDVSLRNIKVYKYLAELSPIDSEKIEYYQQYSSYVSEYSETQELLLIQSGKLSETLMIENEVLKERLNNMTITISVVVTVSLILLGVVMLFWLRSNKRKKDLKAGLEKFI